MHVFMDMNTYEQIEIPSSQIEHQSNFMKANMTVSVMTYEGEILGVELPKNVELEVTETEPGIKGDTQSGGSKSATLETGSVVQVPRIVNHCDFMIIDTI